MRTPQDLPKAREGFPGFARYPGPLDGLPLRHLILATTARASPDSWFQSCGSLPQNRKHGPLVLVSFGMWQVNETVRLGAHHKGTWFGLWMLRESNALI